MNKVILSSEFEFMRGLLERWCDYIKKYTDVFDGDDLPYWYNERANVGVLASAAWASDFIALEEFQIEKKLKKKSRKGRCDLYVCSSNDEDAFIEAKVLFHSIQSDYQSKIDSKLAEALDDVAQVCNDSNRNMGAVFVCPYCKHTESDNIDSEITKFISVIENIEAPIKAWVFPREAQKSQSTHKIPRSYFGVALLMK